MRIKLLLAVAVLAVLPFLSSYAQAPAAANLSPAAAEVVRLAGAGTSEDVVVAYVQNSQAPFNLSADHVLYLKDLGVPSSVVAGMLNHDSALHAQALPPQVEAPPPAAAPVPIAAPVPAPMAAPGPGPEPAPPQGPPVAMAVSTPPADVAYFYNDLAPYGTWVDLPGAGWCWQPSAAASVGGWQPYLHGGHWMNTDAGWFWASDYSWGWAPFHYGRWQMHPTAGWVWFPGRVWGPSWVVWRSGGDHCGWAPLPPHADFVAGVGWSYNGVHVGASFDFGLSVGCFSFVALGHFGDHNLHNYCVPRAQVTQVYKNTTVINNVTYVNNTYVNHGVNVTVFEKAGGHKFERVSVRESQQGVASASAAYRHPLPKPAPITTMSAVKADNHGRIPSSLSSSSKITGATLAGSGNNSSGNAGGQKGNANFSNVKATGATHDFSTDKVDSKNRTGSTLPASTRFNTTSSGNNSQSGGGNGQKGNVNLSNTKATGATQNYNADKLDNKVNPASGLPANNKLTTTGTGATTSVNKSGAAGASSGAGSNAKLYNYQSNPAKAQTDFNAQNKQLNPGDARGASGLTSQKTFSTGDTGNGSGSGNANRLGANPKLQHSVNDSSAGSKNSSGASATKEYKSGAASH